MLIKKLNLKYFPQKIVFPLFQKIYKISFNLYYFLYWIYKSISDYSKIKIIKKCVKKGDTILDVGANVGFYSTLFSKLVGPTGQVIAFEPDAQNFYFLKKVTKRYKNVKCYQKAVGRETGFLTLFKSKQLNVDHQTYDNGENRETVIVEVVSLDEFFPLETVINFIKIDIQGYDYHAFSGMKNLVESSPNVYIIGEIWPYGLKKAGVSYDIYLNLVEDLGLKVQFFHPSPLLKENEDNIAYYTDYFASKNGFPD